MSAHKELVSPEMVEYNPALDFQREPVTPIIRSQVQSEVDNEVSRKSSVISSPVVNTESDLQGDDCVHRPDRVVSKAIMPGHSESRSGQSIRMEGQGSKQTGFIVAVVVVVVLLAG